MLKFTNSKTNSSKPLGPEQEDDLCKSCKTNKKKKGKNNDDKKKKKDKNDDEPKDGHLVSSCLVVLAVLAYVDGKCIPIAINQFRNSHLGIKALRYKVIYRLCNTIKLKLKSLQMNTKEIGKIIKQ